jgi:hypothetical protein
MLLQVAVKISKAIYRKQKYLKIADTLCWGKIGSKWT